MMVFCAAICIVSILVLCVCGDQSPPPVMKTEADGAMDADKALAEWDASVKKTEADVSMSADEWNARVVKAEAKVEARREKERDDQDWSFRGPGLCRKLETTVID